MTILKLIATYAALIAIIAVAQTSEYAGILYFVAALLGMTLLSAHAKSEDNTQVVA